MTAIKLVVADLQQGERGAVRIFADPQGNLEGDLYSNQVAAGRVAGLAQPIPPTLISQIRVVGSSIGDRVWLDKNADGVQDAGEPGFEGVTLELLDSLGTVLDTTVTGPAGVYSFGGWHSESYRVRVDESTLPVGYLPSFDFDDQTVAPDSDSGVFPLGVDVDRVDLDFGYRRMLADLIVSKVVEDAGAGSYGELQQFDLEVTCVTDGTTDDGFPQVLHITGSDSVTIPAPVGSTCVATEPEDGGATSVTVDPASGLFISDDDNAEFEITVTNVFADGSLVIRKALSGAGVAVFGDGPFVFSVVCTYEGDEVHNTEVTLQRTGAETALTSTIIDGIPVGASCVITETARGGADQTPSPVTVVVADAISTVYADLTNFFSAGSLQLQKVLDGPGATTAFALSSEFSVMVSCQLEIDDGAGGVLRTTLYSAVSIVRGGDTVSISATLPHGARCFGEETDWGTASAHGIDYGSYDAAAVVVGSPSALQSLTITATNYFELASIEVSKVVVGAGSAGPYKFEFTCTMNDAIYELPADDTSFSLSHGESRVIDVLPGVDCRVSEVDVPAGVTVSYAVSDGATAGGAADGAFTGVGSDKRVVVTNTYRAALGLTGVAFPTVLASTALVLLALGGLFMFGARRRTRRSS